jgi:hypothetical protein
VSDLHERNRCVCLRIRDSTESLCQWRRRIEHESRFLPIFDKELSLRITPQDVPTYHLPDMGRWFHSERVLELVTDHQVKELPTRCELYAR